jgi:hypothetical protein
MGAKLMYRDQLSHVAHIFPSHYDVYVVGVQECVDNQFLDEVERHLKPFGIVRVPIPVTGTVEECAVLCCIGDGLCCVVLCCVVLCCVVLCCVVLCCIGVVLGCVVLCHALMI